MIQMMVLPLQQWQKKKNRKSDKIEIVCFRHKKWGIIQINWKRFRKRYQGKEQLVSWSTRKKALKKNQWKKRTVWVRWQQEKRQGHCPTWSSRWRRKFLRQSYKDDGMFSDEDYVGFSLIQDVTWNLNDKAGFLTAGFYWTARPPFTYSWRRNFWGTSLMQWICSLHWYTGITSVNMISGLKGYGTIR